jgi:dGTPase
MPVIARESISMAESMRQRLERAEEQRFAPWAARASRATRRYRVEDDGRAFDYRTQFQRDRDRIVYSRAFRRLRQKAQSGILPAYEDHRRNRLTHTLEVTQLSRTIGRALRLNEDLIEAVALGHDLGQPPFGPTGARALDDLLSGRLDGRGGPGLDDLGGFWRSWQGLRVVDRLEKRYEHPGLNLTDAVREGILKSGDVDRAPPEKLAGVRAGRPPALEVQVVVLADRLATALGDLDDAMQSGALPLAAVERLGAVCQLKRKLGRRYRSRASRFMRANAIHRGLTHVFVTAAILAGARTLDRWAERHGVTDPDSFHVVDDDAIQGNEVALPPATRRLLEELEGFVERRVHRDYAADRVDGRGRRIVFGLIAAYHADPALLEPHVLLRYKETAGVRYLRDLPRDGVEREVQERYRRDPRFVRLLADYVAGMTDAYAATEHARLLEMGAVPIPSVEQLRREES